MVVIIIIWNDGIKAHQSTIYNYAKFCTSWAFLEGNMLVHQFCENCKWREKKVRTT